MTIDTIHYLILMSATIVFVMTTILSITEDRNFNIFGAILIGLVTIIGGGTIRDLILKVPIFWWADFNYIWIGIISAIVSYYGHRFFSLPYISRAILYLDGLGAAMFGIIGTEKAWDLGFNQPIVSVTLGVITAIGGGIARDLILRKRIILLRREIYAIPIFFSCMVFVFILKYFPDMHMIGGITCIFGSFILRSAAIYWNLSLPQFSRTVLKNQDPKYAD